MKNTMKIRVGLALALFLTLIINSSAQTAVGDTIIIKTFKYGSTSRDTMINFPNNSQTFEKIIMKYNMRCKNNLVSTQSLPNQGCGEWDYSCNTYVVDSSKIEKLAKTAPNHLISNYTPTTFPYSNQTLYDYYDFAQTNVVLNSIISETLFTIGNGSTATPNFLKANEASGRSQILVKASELTAAGLTAGPIDGFILNVANAGGVVNFFRVKMQHVSATTTVLTSNTTTLTGFTQVYNQNYNFVNGNNRIQFYTPFNWDGTSNVLVDFSFTNTVPTNPIVFNGLSYASNLALYSNNNYAIDLGKFGHAVINTSSLTSINNELTVSLWAYGTASLLPANTSLMYGWANTPNDRSLNIHFPWSDNSMYFDAGFSSGNFDRINKGATVTEIGGQWNHWTFTKNATTGNMRIYLNGALWHSGTAKTKTISLLNLILGKDQNLSNNYKGKINELTIWNKELALVDIQNWMNKPIDATHPFYANLLAYYKMGEGSGQTLNDSKNALTSAGVNLQWSYERGDKLNRMFYETSIRPNVVFFKGTYSTTSNTVTVRDSVARTPHVIQSYSITDNSTVTPMAHDAVVIVSTSNSFQAVPSNIYDGDNNNVLTGTIAVTPSGTLVVTNLNYFERYPFYNEIVSFVTPYGKGLSLGVNGKSWYYDVTDFAPILQNGKRMVMTLGGQYQEQMDIDFYFIVGTPPRTVLEFNQLWQGTNRTGAPSIGSINNQSFYPPTTFSTLAAGKQFKIRSSITGHGAEGEFHQNGGQVTHSLNVNGGANEFSWFITKKCSDIPVFPQGGTWLYDRQGWCPGETSILKEYYVTPYVTPGSTVTLDYNCSNPSVASGDYRYQEAHQLVTYGGANFSLDASILDVKEPSNKISYIRQNAMCSNPKLVVQNTGSTSISSIEFNYWLNNSATPQTYTWTGTLAFLDTVTIKLPIGGLWLSALQPTNNIFYAEIKKVNNVVDDYVFNNKYQSPFNKADQLPDNFKVEFKSNNYASHNTYKIYDDNGNVVASRTGTTAVTIYEDPYVLTGCYRLVLTDAGMDGLNWWANSAQGTGYLRFKDAAGNILKTLQSDFGAYIEYSFTTFPTTSVIEQSNGTYVNIFPNSAHHNFVMNGSGLEFSEVKVMTVLGSVVSSHKIGNETTFNYDSSQLSAGVYFVVITKDGKSTTKKIVIN
ncbi:MAG: T9SS type A sorting domain-containing protein [Sphingobacteriaceae bacterium]|nr:T9SS type A sorting domain-containing protein [Sphingobacteriaceae bacterium]